MGIGDLINIIIFISATVGMRKVFEKAGKKGRQSIIPIYNAYILLKIIGKSGRNMLRFLIFTPFILFSILGEFYQQDINSYLEGLKNGTFSTAIWGLTDIQMAIISMILYLFGFIMLIFPFVFLFVYIYWFRKLAKVFGKSNYFGVGLALLGFIFLPILGFGEAKYIGPKGKNNTNKKNKLEDNC